MKKNNKHGFWTPYIFVSPFLVLFAVFFAFPAVFALVISFSSWNGAGKIEFNGWENYLNLLFSDSNVQPTIMVTVFVLVFGFFLQHLIALPLAILMNNSRLRGRSVFEAMFLFPYLTNTVVIGLLMAYFSNFNTGWVNYFLGWLGVEKINFSQPLPSVILLSIVINWKYIGFNILLYVAGLASIPKELYEAADIDGSSTLTKHRTITLPLLFPILFFAVTLSVINGLQLFDEPYVLFNTFLANTPFNKDAATVAVYILYLMKRTSRFGKSSALSMILFVAIACITFLNRLIENRITPEEVETGRA
jgi:ABC-type sugar transport system permease subunit